MGCKHYLSIGEVAEKTGVNTVTLRAWQRRYGLLKPKRTEKGHRLFSDDDVENILRIVQWLERGISIGKVKPLLLAEAELSLPASPPTEVEGLLSAIKSGNHVHLDSLLNETMKNYPLGVFRTKIVAPIERYLNGSALLGLEAALWRNTLVQRCHAISATLTPKRDRLAVIVSVERADHLVWLTHLELKQRGWQCIVLDELDSFRNLSHLSPQWVLVKGQHKLSQAVLSTLLPLSCHVELCGVLSDIHADFVTNAEVPHPDSTPVRI